jgi:hypothetical protein
MEEESSYSIEIDPQKVTDADVIIPTVDTIESSIDFMFLAIRTSSISCYVVHLVLVKL